MPIPVTCDQCGKFYEVSEKGAGRKFKCKSCSAVLTVPDAPSASSASGSAQKPAQSSSPQAPVRNERAASEAASEKPSSVQKSQKSSAGRTTDGSKSSAGTKKKRSASGTSAGSKASSGKKSSSASRAGKSSAGKSRKKKAGGSAAASSYELFDGDFEDDNDDIFETDDGYDDYSADAYDDYGDDYEDYGDDGDAYDDYGDDYDDYEPAKRSAPKKKNKSKKKQKAKSSSGGGGLAVTFNINRLNALLCIFGGMAIFFGIREARLAANSSSEPTTMTAEELVANGPGDNLYVNVTGILGDLDETVIYYTESRGGDIQSIDEAFVPARPLNSSPTDPIKLIVYSDDADTEAEVAAVASQRSHTGMIVNDIMSISGEKRNLLETTPYLTDVDSAYILHSGRSPKGAALVMLYFIGGGVLLAGGLFWIFFVHE